jgi:L-seryl-tRNA(Ser) seleniumtransferase
MNQSDKTDNMNPARQALLRKLPGVDHLLNLAAADTAFADIPKTVLTSSVRRVLARYRNAILADDPAMTDAGITDAALLAEIAQTTRAAMALNLARAINATGVVVHTNLGRSLLAQSALDHILSIAGRYSNLEYNLAAGKRGSRYSLVEDLICEISGAEAAMVVNNNAAAVLLSLDTIARNREVIVSRGELVEIGGSFRIPDVMAKSGAILKEVGTTNRTHPADYQKAITPETGLLLKVHASNFGMMGFTASVSLMDLVALGERYGLPVMEDLGSGTFVDFSRFGLTKEPTVQESVAAGVDIVTFSGDKLLGGPQAGIIVGTRPIIDKIKENPLTRALRIDKMTLAGLESTLRLYRDEKTAVAAIPTLRMLTCPMADIAARAEALKSMIDAMGDSRVSSTLHDLPSRAGGGALPLLELPSRGVGITISAMTAAMIENRMRRQSPPIIGRIIDDLYLMDMRTVQTDELPEILFAIQTLLKGDQHARI